MTQMSTEQLLWQAYREAFCHFQGEAASLSTVNARSSFNPAEAEKALSRLEHAHLAYNEIRDSLAASRMPAELAHVFWSIPAAAVREQDRVKNIAELLWELAGKPQGSAEDDWYRAERVARYVDAEICCAR